MSKARGSQRCAIVCWKCGAQSPSFVYRYVEDEDGVWIAYPGKDFPEGWLDSDDGESYEDEPYDPLRRDGGCPSCVENLMANRVGKMWWQPAVAAT